MRAIKLALVSLIIAYLFTGSDRFTRLQDIQWITQAEFLIKNREISIQSRVLMNPTFLVGPTDDLKWVIINRLNAATERIFLSVYMLTEPDIIQALIFAKQRWVRVRVILEPSVYLLPKINQKAYALLRSAEIDVKYSSERDFNFNHSKYFVIDQTALIGTGNMTKTSLIQNREFFVIMTSVPEIEYLVTLFERDIEHVPPFKPNNSLVVAPINARVIIHSLINESLKSLTIMSESLSDSQILGLLVTAKERGVRVIVCLPHDRPLWVLQKVQLQNAGILLLTSRKPHVHAKTLLSDDRELLVGSINFTENSIDRNREVAVIIGGSAIIQRYNKTIETDCKG